MMRIPLLSVAALLIAAVSAPAQVSVEAKLGRHLRGSVVLGGGARHHDHGGADHRHDPRGRGHHDHHDHHDHGGRVRRAPAPVRGHWRTVEDRVLVPGHWHEEHVPPTYGWIHDSCGHRQWGVVDRGGCRRVWVPARWETRCRQVWVPC